MILRFLHYDNACNDCTSHICPVYWIALICDEEIRLYSLSADDNQYLTYLNFIAGPNFIPILVKWVSVSKTKVLPSIFSFAKDSA